MSLNFTEKVRDPIHGFIRFSKQEEQIINHPYFQRLRNVRQLSSASLVFPGATHSRFEHSLGVMELASRTFQQLATQANNQLTVLSERVGKDPDSLHQTLRLAALLHDVGHPPFSHAGEIAALGQHKVHEVIGQQLIKDGAFTAILEGIDRGTAGLVVNILSKAEPFNSVSELLRKILKADIDVDRTDYLLRDAYHCGVEYGRFDVARLTSSFTLKETKVPQFAIQPGGVHAVEEMIFARYFMYSQVYYNRHVMKFDYYLSKYLHEFYIRNGINSQNVLTILEFTDSHVLSEMSKAVLAAPSKKYNEEEIKWARLFLNRSEQYECVLSTCDYAAKDEIQVLKTILQELKASGFDVFSVNRDDTIHKYKKRSTYITCDRCLSTIVTKQSQIGDKSSIKCGICEADIQFGESMSPPGFMGAEELSVVQTNKIDSELSLMEVSPILELVPSAFHIERVYARGDSVKMASIRNHVRDTVKREKKSNPNLRFWRY